MTKHNYRRFASRNRRRNFDDPLYVEFRKAVRKRDKHRCKFPNCKATRRIQVHHIRKWEDYPSLRYTVSNGICLCDKHHKQTKGKEEQYQVLFYGILIRNEEIQSKGRHTRKS